MRGRLLTRLALMVATLFAMWLVAPGIASAGELTVPIGVTATDPCCVELRGILGDDGDEPQCVTLNGKGTIPVVVDEPGEYGYELRQVEADGFPVYDQTVYHVFLTAYYEGDEFLAVVTGGIDGTDDKPEAFAFSKPATADSPEPATTSDSDASPVVRSEEGNASQPQGKDAPSQPQDQAGPLESPKVADSRENRGIATIIDMLPSMGSPVGVALALALGVGGTATIIILGIIRRGNGR